MAALPVYGRSGFSVAAGGGGKGSGPGTGAGPGDAGGSGSGGSGTGTGGAGEGGSEREPEFRLPVRVDTPNVMKGGPERAVVIIASTPAHAEIRFLHGHFGTAPIGGRAWGGKRYHGYFLKCRGLNR